MEKRNINYDSIVKKINEGNESYIYLYKDKDGNDVVLKYFKDKIKVVKCGKVTETPFTEKNRKNKEEKVRLLYREPCLLDDPKVLDLMYDEDKGFIGYTMEYSKLPTMEDYIRTTKRTKLELLKNLRKRIEELNYNGLYIGDFMSPENFLVDDDGSIKLVDMDNFHVHGLDFDLSNPYIDSYEDRNKSIKNVDNYGFNFFTISYYSRMIMQRLLVSLPENGMPHRFNTKENKELVYDMLTKKNYEKRYILDSQKKGLF